MAHFSSKAFFYLFFLSFLSGNSLAADEEIKDSSLTTKPSGNIKAYYELRGKQVERCINDSTFSRGGKIRWVNNLNLLWCSKTISNYGPLVDAEQEWRRDKSRDIPGTAIHEKLTHIGSSLKVLNGYYGDKGNNDPLDGITPDSTNFLVPYISFVVKEDNGVPNFQPGGYFCRSDKDTAVVFVSGGGKYTDKSALEAGFNMVIRNVDEEPSISILSGDDIERSLLEEGLRKAYLDPGSFVFSEAHKNVFYNEFVKKLLEMYNALSGKLDLRNIQLNIGSIYWIARTLSSINNNKTFLETETQNYISILNNCNLPYNYLEVFIADLKDSQKSPNIMHALALGICDIYGKIKSLNYEQINQIRGFVIATHYLENPNPSKVIENDHIDALKKLPPYSFKGISIQDHYKNLIKPGWDNWARDHTEYFLVSYVKAYSDIILNLLKEIKIRSNTKKIALKSIILDVHSWLDICGKCQPQFFSQWETLIHSLCGEIENLGFTLPKDKPKVLIRMSSLPVTFLKDKVFSRLQEI